ncbi:NAD(P)H-hydrate dehydratase [Evansella sp. AB-P1]|uniref:NAD(P)H-hydrate dehydratase n=1 Tax=Evansella sp. AB-P1 TaxID=3037653 RepID=UPI00241E0EE1|nr:NAD(P)H-hydrate dehydratase [Evansella sp. AB-P1]MDG5787946.1 NAD(P)H-hydrate dehydratase [Evansella sp. AB-P1]
MYVVTGDEMHQIDRYTMDVIGLNEVALMESAGQAFCRQLLPSLQKKDQIVVLIGSGNNGGDGFVIGRILKEAGYNVDVWVIPPEHKIRGAALTHLRIYERSGHAWFTYSERKDQVLYSLNNYAIIVDALLGTGIKGEPRTPYKELIDEINLCSNKVISVDVPSGVPSGESDSISIAVKADETYTFQAPKIGAYCFPYSNYYGKLQIFDIGIPLKAFEQLNIQRMVITEDQVRNTLAKRMPDAHKGSVGKAIIIGGAQEMIGAPVLSTEACLRSGVGLVTLAVPDVIHPIVTQKTTEATFWSLKSNEGQLTNDFLSERSLDGFDGIAIGPGMGRDVKHDLFTSFKDFKGPLVIDADGLFHLSKELEEWLNGRPGGPTVITPHSGEMARLVGVSIAEIETNRFALSKAFAKKYNMYVVLKGPKTIVTTPLGEQWVNTTGNASLAKGGSGDVLTGMILAFLLQHNNIITAIINAVYIHGKSADDMIKTHDIMSVNASDIVDRLPLVIRSLRYQ